MKKRLALLFFFILFLLACHTYKDLPYSNEKLPFQVMTIPASPQQVGGDPKAGFDYLINGDYIGSGIPYTVFQKRLSKGPDTVLRREGINANVPYAVTAFVAPNGVKVVNGNCFTCHASPFEGEIVFGLGNSFSDYRKSLVTVAKLMNMGMRLKYKKSSEKFQAYQDFGNYFKAMAPHIKTNQAGANPAFRLAEACMMQRNPVDLTYVEAPIYEINKYPIATDVPALWNVKKKNALYYNGIGRGDFTKLLFQASVLGIPDSSAARKAVTHFKDVLAWLQTLEAPAYPKPIDQLLADKGKMLFESACSKCHGTYGEKDQYPNKLVALEEVKTDPLYAHYAYTSGIVEWYNSSWFAHSAPRSYFEPTLGYVAPPLDGVWATAPYFHNGSVPTLMDVLNSKSRPTYWSRNGEQSAYDYENVGWQYEIKDNKKGKWTFDSKLPGFSNKGHDFGDAFTNAERKALIEYLKTL
ncbi:MAG: c-type cytochrome [Saprospiraceae bacterium]